MEFKDIPTLTEKDIQRFLKKVTPGPTNECWIWNAGNDGKYGKLFLSGAEYKAHRIAFVIWKGRKPNPSLDVCHECDTPLCVNPHHLFEGSRSDNLQDCLRKGRFGERNRAKGDDSLCSKLTTHQVEEIRGRYVPRKVSTRKLAAEYGVARSLIHRIVTGQARCTG